MKVFTCRIKSSILLMLLSILSFIPFVERSEVLAETSDELYTSFDKNGERFSAVVEPFFKQHCMSCHGPDKEKGSLRVDHLMSDLDDEYSLSHFQNIIDELITENMPPEDEEQPKHKEVLEVIELLTLYVKAGQDKHSSGGGKPVRRLSRSEYKNTVWDQLGVYVTDEGLPEDLLMGSFETDAENLYMTDMHFKAYLSKSRVAVKKFIESRSMKPGVYEVPVKFSNQMKKNSLFILMANNVPAAGSLKIKTKWWKRDPDIKNQVTIGLNERGIEHEITGTSTNPQNIEVEFFKPDGGIQWKIKSATTPSRRVSKGLTKEENEKRMAAHKKIKANNQNLLKLQQGKYYHPVLLGEVKNYHQINPQPYEFFSPFLKNGDEPADSEAPKIIKSFVSLIKRGQYVDFSYLNKLNMIFTRGREQGMAFWEAMEEPLAVSLCSLDVIYHFENRSTSNKDKSITGIELANRLAYTLWRSVPDSELIKLAKNETLLMPEIKKEQIQRMMKDDKFERFLNDFTIQWFELQRQDLIAVDRELFEGFDQVVKPAMKEETIQFMSHLVNNNFSLTNLIDSDFLILNNTIARHYGIPNIYGNNFRAVQKTRDAADRMRGGVLTHAGILMQGGTGDRTSIVERGAFVARKLINKAPAPPPPNAGELPTNDADTAKMTGAELVRHHASSPQCASCHAKIDPLGIGLEQFDAIGRTRTQETRLKPGVEVISSEKKKKGKRAPNTIKVPLETKGTLYDGQSFDGVIEMKRVLMTKKHDLSKGFIKALLYFTNGRRTNFADDAIAKDIAEKVSKNNYPTRQIIEDVMNSKALITY